MTQPALQPLSVDQFLEWDSGDDRGYELVEGQIVAMAPPTSAHQILAANVARRMAEALDARPPCTVRVEAPIPAVNRDDTCHQADLAVTCRPDELGQKVTPDPVVIVEILSPTTEGYDRRVKLPDYRAIPSVQEIVLIDQRQVSRTGGPRFRVQLPNRGSGVPDSEFSCRIEDLGVPIPN